MKIIALAIGLGFTQVFINHTVDFIGEATGFRKPKHPITCNWVCPSCGWDNSDNATHCKICGRYK